MINITKDLPSSLLVKNKEHLEVTLTGIYSGYHSAQGAYFDINFTPISSTFNAGNEWHLHSLATGNIVFTIHTVPDYSLANELLDASYGTGFSTYEEYLIHKLKSHPAIAKYYIVEGHQDASLNWNIRIKSRFHGSRYILQINMPGTTVTNNGIGFPLTVDTDTLNRNLKVMMRLWIETELDSPIFKEIGVFQGFSIDRHEENSMVVAFNDIPSILQAHLDADLPQDAFSVFKCGTICKRFYYEVWAEWYDNSNAYKATSIITSKIKWALLGGIDIEHANWWEHWQLLYRGSGVSGIKFLSFQALDMHMHYKQYQWTAIFIDEATASALASTSSIDLITYLSYDGIAGSAGSTSQNINILKGPGLYYIPIGYNQLGLTAFETSGTFNRIDIELNTYGAVGTSRLIIHIDKRELSKSAIIAYHTSLAAFETFINEIKEETTLKIDQKNTANNLQTPEDASIGNYNSLYISDQKTMKLRTNWICGPFKDLINDFILATYKYMVPKSIADSDTLPEYKRINNITDEVQMANDEFKYELNWEMQEAWTDTVYTNMPVIDRINYDELFDFTVINDELFPITIMINNSSAISAILYINGIKNVFAPGSNYYDVPYKSSLNFRILSKQTGTFDMNGGGVKYLFFNKIICPNLNVFNLLQIKEAITDVLEQYIVNMAKLTSFTINNIDNSYKVDRLLQELSKCYQLHNTLNAVDISASSAAPSFVGINAKDFMLTYGLTVTTN